MQIFNTTYRFFSDTFHKLPNWITRHKRYYKACMSGVISLGVQLIVFNILRLYIKSTIANTIAVEIAIITNFIVNYHFTFGDHKKAAPSLKNLVSQFITFNGVSLSSMLIQFLCLHAEMAIFGRHLLLENIAILIGIILGSIVNFILYKLFVWR
jgi:dolichol-phosphate mannosyltransferase